MRYYATVESERGGRPARKGADEHLEIVLTEKGITEYIIIMRASGLTVWDEKRKEMILTVDKGKT